MNKPLVVRAMPDSHDKIFQLLSDMPPGKLLDAPSGSGVLSQKLSAKNFDVCCCDIDEDNFNLKDELPFTTADFNRDKLNYSDSSFDYIICVNGLHRLYSLENIFSEFNRVAKPGATLIFSIPHYTSTARRLKFLISGSIGDSIDFAVYDQGLLDPAANIRAPLSMIRANALSEKHNFSLVSVESVGMQMYDYLLIPFSALLSITNRLFGNKLGNQFRITRGGNTAIAIYKKGG